VTTDPDEAGRCSLCGHEASTEASGGGGSEQFCSSGCRDVYETLGAVDSTGSDDAGGEVAEDTDSLETGETSGDAAERDTVQTFLRVDGMYSATCESYLEAVAERQDGVVDAEASYVTETIRVTHDPERASEAALRDALSRLGYSARSRENASEEFGETRGDHRSRGMPGRDGSFLELRYAVGLLFGAFLMLPYVAVLYPIYLASFVNWGPLRIFQGVLDLSGASGLSFLRLYLLFTGLILVFTGLPVLRGAYISLRMRQPNTDLLVAITVTGAYVSGTVAVLVGRTSVFFDLTVVVAATVTTAMFYESSIKQRALGRLTDLTVSQVDTAQVYEADGTTDEVPVEALTPGDRVLVPEGDRIPVDGTLAAGECTVDEAVVTGESLPISKRTGDEVVGGSVVTSDAAVVRVGESARSSIERITTSVWEVQSADHGAQRRADRLAARAVGPLVGAAVLAGAAGIWLGRPAPDGLLLALTVLLVGSPWVLGLATPLSVATSLEEALRRGIVVFDETVFERLRDVDVVVFDKTGTLTTGEMEVVESDAPSDLLAAAARLERRAAHPAANAIAAAFARGADDDPSRPDGGVVDEPEGERERRVSEFTSHPTGVEGVIDGTEILVGDLDLFAQHGWTVSDDIRERVADARGFGRLPVVVGRDGVAAGIVVVGDEPREGWDETITRLGRQGAEVVVLTGDDEEATDFFRGHASVTHVFAGISPEGKTATIQRLRSDGRVAMVGDGTNDAPALAAADLGISLGGGTALAADAADLAIADDRISSVETAFDIASAAHRRVRQNNGLALAYNGIAAATVAAGIFNPVTVMAAVAASGGLVLANATRDLIDDDRER